MTNPEGPGGPESGATTSCVLCTVPRSGSWLLSDLLEQTGLVGRPEEYFRPDHLAHWAVEWGISPRAPYGRFVTTALERTATDNGVFSVKLHWYQLEWFLAQLRDLPWSNPLASDDQLLAQWLPRPHYVRLWREDSARQAISYYRAEYSDRWFELSENDPESTRPRLYRPVPMPEVPDFGHVRHLENIVLDHQRRWNAFFEDHGIRPLEVRYEDMIEDYGATVQAVLAFLDVEVARESPPRGPRVKQQADELTERWLQDYLAVRDSVEAQPINLAERRAAVEPQSRRSGPDES